MDEENYEFYDESFSSINELLKEPIDNLFPDYLLSFYGIDRGNVDGFRRLPEVGRAISSICFYEPDAVVGDLTNFFTTSGFCVDDLLNVLQLLGLQKTINIISVFRHANSDLLGKSFSYNNEEKIIEACSDVEDFSDNIAVVMSEAESLLEKLHALCVSKVSELSKFESDRRSM